jgi:hypothetical protein
VTLSIRVKGGTTDSQTDLCLTCTWATRARNVNQLELTKCTVFGLIRNRISECSGFQSRKQPHGLLYQTAWGYDRDVNTGESHFYHPQDKSWSKLIPPPPPPPKATPPPKPTWRRRLRSSAHRWLDLALRPVTKASEGQR